MFACMLYFNKKHRVCANRFSAHILHARSCAGAFTSVCITCTTQPHTLTVHSPRRHHHHHLRTRKVGPAFKVTSEHTVVSRLKPKPLAHSALACLSRPRHATISPPLTYPGQSPESLHLTPRHVYGGAWGLERERERWERRQQAIQKLAPKQTTPWSRQQAELGRPLELGHKEPDG